MTTAEVNVTDEMMDFSLARRTLKFRVDDDVFEAVPEIPVDVALAFADRAEQLESADTTQEERLDIVRSLLRAVLRSESADRFVARLGDRDNPIGIQRFVDVVKWLFGEYGMRPTEPGSTFSTGLGNPVSGTNSTVSTSREASISADSVSIAS